MLNATFPMISFHQVLNGTGARLGKRCKYRFAAETIEVIAKPPNISHAKFAKYAKFCFMDDFANLADFA